MDYEIAMKKIKEIIFNSKNSEILENVVDFLYKNFDKYHWIGIYVVHGNDLSLGPWRGKQATEHTKIPIGKGICGSAAKTGKIERISNVKKDDRYLACFASTKSEMVVPIKKNEKIIGEIDIDSDISDAFDEKDAIFLEKIANIIYKYVC
ncbi:MAG: GAF domain-containing protein [Thermoplasmatales archaeon]|nr:MAG: GAF domain-containing protein [Thermoplasmatales archaeon]